MTQQKRPVPGKVLDLQSQPGIMRLAPHSPEAEEAVIGGVLTDPDAFYGIASYLKPQDFHINRLAIVWEAMLKVAERHEGIDVLTVSEEIRAMGKAAQFDDKTRGFLTNLINRTPTSVHTETYASVIERLAIRRRLLTVADEIKALAYDEQLPIEIITTQSEERLFDATGRANREQEFAMEQLLEAHNAYVEAVSKDSGVAGLKLYISALDQQNIMIFRKDVHVLAAPSGQGKSSFLLNTLAINQLRMGKLVVIITNEMNEAGVIRRLISGEAAISEERLRQGTMSPEEKRRYLEATARMANWRMLVVSQLNPANPVTPLTVERTLRRIEHFHGNIDLVIIDGMKAMKFAVGYEGEYQNELKLILPGLKGVADQMNVPLFCAHHLNRQSSKKTKPPTLEGMYGGSAIEQYADTVWALWREEYDPMIPNQPSHLISLKVRSGTPYFDEVLQFNKAANRYDSEQSRINF